MLFIKSKIQFFESKSQRKVVSSIFGEVVYQVKDTIFWKQITTFYYFILPTPQLFIKSKIQFFESKSQPLFKRSRKASSCLSSQRYNFLKANHNFRNKRSNIGYVVYQVKDTIFWKQITTVWTWVMLCRLLFIKSKIQFFESKSQLKNQIMVTPFVVYQVKDTIFWKQITTCRG